MQSEPEDRPLRVGVSACLVGRKVRWDGGHKEDDFITGELARWCELVPVCPELEAGMGVPREPVRLVGRAEAPRMLGVDSGKDHTAEMLAWARKRLAELARLELDGYVLKKDSPSCGMERVRVYPAGAGDRSKAIPEKRGVGLFARALAEAMPLLPTEEEGRLRDVKLRETFVIRVFAHRRVTRLFERAWKPGDLVRFHSGEKLLLMAHSPKAYAALGRLVAGAGVAVRSASRAEVAAAYRAGFMAALARPATTKTHANVLQHMAGYFKKTLDDGDRRELAAAIDDFRRGRVPLLAPLTLIAHHVRRQDVAWLAQQSYLAPHPREMMLRNHA